ncbi:MAG: hypothetical protein KF906_02710 [Actinobacteria bacterium]|nr:hypothetical protein [Actinomycetota bacterium]
MTASWWWAIRTSMRRGPAVAAFAVTLVVSTLHVVLRATWWRYEWHWAWYQYHFGTILLGPVVAGIAYDWGAVLHRSRPVLEAAGRVWAALSAAGAALILAVLTAYLLVLGGVSVVVGRTTGLGPDAATFATLAPPVALLIACIAVGSAVGFRVGSRGLAPVWAIITFAFLMAGYMVFPARFTKVGGATASLVGIRTRPQVQVGQVALFLGVTLFVVGLASLPRRSNGAQSMAAIGLALGLGGFGFLLAQPKNEFRPRDFALTCVGEAPRICLEPGWVAAEPDIREPLARYDRSLAAAGLPRVEIYAQRWPSRGNERWLDAVSVLRYSKDGPEDGLVVNQYLPDECWKAWDDGVSAAVTTLESYLARAWEADGRLKVSDAERASLQQAVRTIQACRN